jgi:prephenate dehydrogenase
MDAKIYIVGAGAMGKTLAVLLKLSGTSRLGSEILKPFIPEIF